MASRRNTNSQNADLIATFGKMLDEKMKSITERLEKIENSLLYALDEINKISVLEEKCETQREDFNRLQADMDNIKSENRSLKEQLLKQETYSRRNNIRIMGVQCQGVQSLETVVIQTLAKVGINITEQDIAEVHFIGPKREEQSRPVIVKVWQWKLKDKILKAKQNLRKISVIVQEDFPREIVERRKLLLPIFYKSRQLHPELNPRFTIDRLILGGKIYTIDNIHTISVPLLSPENVFTPCHNGVQAFYSKYSPLSNHHPAEFDAEGKHFTSSEQYFMYKKAIHFKDQETAQVIHSAHDAVQIKQLGKTVRGYKKAEWYQVAPDHMYEAMYAKFNQNEQLKQFLLSTGRNTLVEANMFDKFWGAGLPLNSREIFDPTKWPGKNHAGKTLERVRQTLT